MKARGIILLCLFGAYLFMVMYVMKGADKKLNVTTTEHVAPLDLQMGYDTVMVRKTLEQMGPQGREAYKSITTREDIAYPLIYGSLFCLTIIHFSRLSFPKGPKLLSFLGIFPILTILMDILENILLLNILKIYPNINPGLTQLASSITSLKWGFALLSIGLIFTFIIIYLLKRFVFRTIKLS